MNNKIQGKDYDMTDVKQRHKQKTVNKIMFNHTQAHFRRHKHTAWENQRYLSLAVQLASSSRTPNWEPLV